MKHNDLLHRLAAAFTAMRWLLTAIARTLLAMALLVESSANAAEIWSGDEVASLLGTLQGVERYHGLVALLRGGRIGATLTGAEGTKMLHGMEQAIRAAAIAQLAGRLAPLGDGHAAATLLGPVAVLAEADRYHAIAALVRARRIPSGLDAEEALAVLNGITLSSRVAAIAAIAPLLRAELLGPQLVAILGPTLTVADRYHALAALARANRIPPALDANGAAALLNGIAQSSRAATIALLAPCLRDGLSGGEIAQILGTNGELTDGDRYHAIATLARARRLGYGLGVDVASVLLQGMTGQTRVAAMNLLRVPHPAGRASACGRNRVDSPQPAVSASAPAAATPHRVPPSRESASVLGTCGSSAIQRALIPDKVCISSAGKVAPYQCTATGATICDPANRRDGTGEYCSTLVHFTSACSKHDACYGVQGAVKSACDAAFYANLKAACRARLAAGFPESGRLACYEVALRFSDVVRSKGCDAFKRAQVARHVNDPQCR